MSGPTEVTSGRHGEAVARLREILAVEGPGAFDDPPRLRGLISDRLAGMRREVPALIGALNAGLPQRLRLRQSGTVDAAAQRALEAELVTVGLAAPDAAFAVAAWMEALGHPPTRAQGPVSTGWTSTSAPAGPWYRQPLVMAGGAVAGLVLIVAVAASALGDDTPTPSAPPSVASVETDPPPAGSDPVTESDPPVAESVPPTEPAGVPTMAGTAADDWLYRQVYLRSDIASCEVQELRDSQITNGVIASLDCAALSETLDDGTEYKPTFLAYDLYDSTANLDGFYEFVREQSELLTDLCGPNWVWETTSDVSNGRHLCRIVTYDSGAQEANLMWSEDDWRILASMYGPQPAEDLNEFWEKSAIAGTPANPQH